MVDHRDFANDRPVAMIDSASLLTMAAGAWPSGLRHKGHTIRRWNLCRREMPGPFRQWTGSGADTFFNNNTGGRIDT